MVDLIGGALLIMMMRICDVTIGTFRTILIVQGRKLLAGTAGFFEVLIWVFAIRFVFQHLDNLANFFGYAVGFGIGNILGITLEQKVGLGYVQFNIISKLFPDQIADALRKSKYGVTILPGEGGSGGVAILMCIAPRKHQKRIIEIIEDIDKTAFINIQSSIPYRGFMHGARK
ncbi:MAG TPA: DUF5698 domain-containing protein [Ignavibacteriaceae bacterium]|jgi:uncharacterized protein YebE (UPF0316 family)|nr:DUF5698 domain-containing protein [Ignavibacteriaceae bacterium]